ncbi:hypothetical protein EYZ11_000211 [Aspergillus tanneri]|uniref:Serine hydrolase domain-containing protein n=1 Tax=Aspergillus tanneri TaxID=1220188 RepID=A0A4S3JXX0_9EURO|nr:hypothetical protein EYZ11_000211 [Aspergillus tanneri]
MKILCLHGQGTSGSIFRSQTSSIRNRLHDLPIEYDFLDGPYPATAAAGIDLFYPPPYYSYLESNTPVGIRNSVSWLKEYIAQHGPYDAVMMFSQGCTIGASLLLLHQLETPDRPAPFKAAIFICGGPPLKLLEEVGYRISERVWERDATSRAELAAAAHSESILAKGSGRWNADAMKGETEEGIRGEISGGVKIGIPTVHVYGEKDPRYVAGIQLSEVCEPRKRRTYNHGGGHEIPRLEKVTVTVVELVRWALTEGGAI